jgi:hypothetical protein
VIEAGEPGAEAGTALLDALIKLAPDQAHAIRRAAAEFGNTLPYEIAYAVTPDGKISLSGKAAITFDKDGKIKTMSCTETVDPNEPAVFRGHTHPDVAAEGDEAKFAVDQANLNDGKFGRADRLVILQGADAAVKMLKRASEVSAAEAIFARFAETALSDGAKMTYRFERVPANAATLIAEIDRGAISARSAIEYLEERAGATGAVSVLAFDASSVDGSVRDLIEAASGRENVVRVVIFGEGDNPPADIAGAIYIKVSDASKLSRSIEDEAAKDLGAGSRVNQIAILRVGGESAVESDLNSRLSDKVRPNYVLVKGDAKMAGSADVNMANLLMSVMKAQPCFMAVGYRDGEASLGKIKDILAQMGGIFRIFKDINRAMSEMYLAIRATAVAA